MENKINKPIGIVLGAGILLFPYFFSWITLRKGYSESARVISFLWLFFIVSAVTLGGQHNGSNTRFAALLVITYLAYKAIPIALRFFRSLLSPLAKTQTARRAIKARADLNQHIKDSAAAAGFKGEKLFSAVDAVEKGVIDSLDKASKPLNEVESKSFATEFKTCPFCAEAIKVAAIKCKHCGSSL